MLQFQVDTQSYRDSIDGAHYWSEAWGYDVISAEMGYEFVGVRPKEIAVYYAVEEEIRFDYGADVP